MPTTSWWIKKTFSYGLAFSAMSAVGCGSSNSASSGGAAPAAVDTQAFRASSPDTQALSLDTSGTASTLARDVAPPTDSDPFLSDKPRLLLEDDRKGIVVAFNAAIKPITEEISTLVAGTPLPGTANSNAQVHTWVGDSVSGKSTFQFVTRRGDKGVGWKFSAKAKGADDSTYKVVLSGRLRKGALDHRGEGVAAIDFSNQVAGDLLSPATGKVFLAFNHGDDHSHAFVYRVENFSADGSAAATIEKAYFSGSRWHSRRFDKDILFLSAGGKAEITQAYDAATNTPNGAADAGVETVSVKYRRVAGVGGWARSRTINGDVPAGRARVARVCWGLDANDQETTAYRRVWDCPSVRLPGAAAQCRVLASFNIGNTTLQEDSDPDSNQSLEPMGELCFKTGSLRGDALAELSLMSKNDKDPPADVSQDPSSDASLPGEAAVTEEPPPASVPSGDGKN